MKKKYPKIDLEKFSPETITEMGLCPTAFKRFKKDYGDTVHPLSNHKATVINLIDEGKGEWVITFCTALMESPQHLLFAKYVIGEVQRDFKGRIIERICLLLDQHISGEMDNAQDIQNAQKMLESEVLNMPQDTWPQQCVFKIYKGLINLIRACSEGENINQRMTVAIRCFVEAYALDAVARDNFAPIQHHRVDKFKHFGLYAMKLTGVWPFE
jgi:hypothetical protein